MADAQRTIDLIFNGVDKTGAATLSALNNAEKFSTSLKSVTQPISDFTVGAVKLEAGLLAAGVAMTTFAVKAASDFDTNFRQISTIVDASDEDLNAFRESILKYASTSRKPLEEITAALGAAIGSGVDYADSLSLLASAEKLSIATRSDLQSTTKVLVSTINSYGMEMADVGKLSDVFFQIIDDGDISMNDLAESFAKVAPVAKIAGVPIEELGAAIATLTAAGIKPAESIEAVRAAIGNIIAPSKEASDTAAALGINFSAAGLQASGFSGLLQQIGEKTGGNAEQIKALFGSINGFTAAATLAGPQAEAFARTIESMREAAGATDKAYAKMALELGASTQLMANAFKVLLVNIGDPLLDEFGGVARAIAAIFTALGTSVTEGGLKKVVEFVEKLFKDLQGTLETVAKNLPAALEKADFRGFTGGIQAVVDAFKKLFAGIDLSTVAGLTKAIEVAGAAFLGLSKFTGGVIESFKPLFDLLVKMGSEVGKVDTGFIKAAGNIGGAVVQFNALLGVFGGLVPVLSTIVGLFVANQALSVVGALSSMSTVLPAVARGFSLLTMTPAGLATIGAIAAITPALIQWQEAQTKLTEAQQRGQAIQERAVDTLEKFRQSTGTTVKTIDEAMRLVEDGTVVWSDHAEAYVSHAKAIELSNKATRDALDPYGEMIRKAVESADAADRAAASTTKLAGSQQTLAKMVPGIVPIIDAATGKITGYERGMVKATEASRVLGKAVDSAAPPLKTSGDVMEQLGKKTNLTNAELITLAKNVKDAEIELEKIASNERIKLIESTVTLNVANIEAQTKRAEAAFVSLSATVTSTENLLGDLFGLLGNENKLSFGALSDIRDQIDLENKRRDEALKLQGELTRAQIDTLKAQARALESGQALISISGEGLEPHIEAFMWEILKKVQVRANRDGLNLLLGI